MKLNGVSFSDTDFFLQQKQFERGWLKPVGLALTFHFITLVVSATLPELMNRKPLLDDVVTINLVSLPEVSESVPQQKAPAPEPETVTKLEPAKAKAAVAMEPEPVQENPVPVKPVSLKPIKRKVRKTDPHKLAEEKARREQEKKKKQALNDARMNEELARQAAQEARAALAEMIRQKGVKAASSSSSRKSSGSKEVQSIVFKQYLSSLYDRVQSFWVLPDMRQWDVGLETVVVLTIRRDGTVTSTTIEKKSKDPFFDQFVMKTVQNAVPMPRFPTLMTQSSIEVGLRFRPGELLM